MRSPILAKFIAFNFMLLFACEPASLGQSTLWQSYLKKGFDLMEQKNYLEAEKILRLAIRELDLDTDSRNNMPFMAAHLQLGLCLKEEKKLEESETEFAKTIVLAEANETESKFLRLYDDLGNVQVELKKYALAEENYRKCLRRLEELHAGPQSQRAVLLDLIGLYNLEGKTTEAAALNERVANLDGQIKQLQAQPKYFYDQGLRSLGAKDYLKSIELLEKAVSLDPTPLYVVNLAVAHQNFAVTLVDKDNKEAEHHYKEAIRLFEKDSRAQAQLSSALESLVIFYVKCKRFTDAEPCVKRLLTLRNAQRNMEGYARAHKLYSDTMKAQNKPVTIGAIPANLNPSKPLNKTEEEISTYDRSVKLRIHQKWRALEGKYAEMAVTHSTSPASPSLGYEWAVVWIVIAADGSLKESKLQTINHNEKFEARALEAVQASVPFGPLPKMAGNTHAISVSFNHTGCY